MYTKDTIFLGWTFVAGWYLTLTLKKTVQWSQTLFYLFGINRVSGPIWGLKTSRHMTLKLSVESLHHLGKSKLKVIFSLSGFWDQIQLLFIFVLAWAALYSLRLVSYSICSCCFPCCGLSVLIFLCLYLCNKGLEIWRPYLKDPIQFLNNPFVLLLFVCQFCFFLLFSSPSCQNSSSC